MRIAVVSDIHGNLTALEAVLLDLRSAAPDLVVHGGDLADGGARPAEVVEDGVAIRRVAYDVERELGELDRFGMPGAAWTAKMLRARGGAPVGDLPSRRARFRAVGAWSPHSLAGRDSRTSQGAWELVRG